MADTEGVKTPTPAQSEDGTTQTQNVNPFEDVKVKERMGAISADKNRWKDTATEQAQYIARLEAEKAKAVTPDSYDSGDPDDADAVWSRKYLLDPLEKRMQEQQRDVDAKITQLADRFEKEDFWKDYPGDISELKTEVEETVTQLQQSGQPVNRQFVRWLVQGRRQDEAHVAETEAAVANEQATQTVNEKARVAEGGTPKPEPEKTFDDLSPDEKFNALSKDGAFNRLLGGSR